MITKPLARVKLLSNHLKASFSTEDPVLFQEGKNGVRVVLNRPAKLNAIDIPMLNLIDKQIEHWNQEKNIKVLESPHQLLIKHLRLGCSSQGCWR